MKEMITMTDVIRALGMESQYPPVSGSKDYVCPYCDEGDNKKKLNIDFRKNVFRCNRCEEFKGNAVDFWAYYRGLEWGNKEARKKAAKDFFTETRNGKANYVKQTPKRGFAPPPDIELADIETLHNAYSAFLEQLTLEQKHLDNLTKQRGLSKEQVIANGYKTAPLAGGTVIAQNILNSGIPLEGVPGFYIKNGAWQFVNYGSGFLIPTRDLKGRIQGLQFRADDSPSGKRYFTISSSGRDHGTKGKTKPHFNKGKGDLSSIIITEGPLKGDIISYYSGIPTLSVLGVSALNFVPDILKELRVNGCRDIILAYDMDLNTNKHVYKALTTLKKMISSHAFTYKKLVWDINEGKGLDDLYFYKEQYKV